MLGKHRIVYVDTNVDLRTSARYGKNEANNRAERYNAERGIRIVEVRKATI